MLVASVGIGSSSSRTLKSFSSSPVDSAVNNKRTCHTRSFVGTTNMTCEYRSVPLICPPILYTTSSLKWGEGLYSNMQLVSNISPPPPPKVLRDRYVHFQSSCLCKNTVTKAHRYYIGEELPIQCEVNNIHDDFAVAVLKNSNTVGHVPREISRVCCYFLHKSGSEMTCIVNGDRRRSEVDGKGLVVPCVYIFKGKQKHLE